MNIRKRMGLVFALLLLALSVAPAIAQEAGPDEADLRIGILPVMNIYPFYANPLGYFEEAGVSVQMVPVFSAQELREGIAAGDLDGFQADLITTLVLLEAGYDVRLVRHVGLLSPPLFGILAYESSGIMSAEDLAGARIGISEKTVVQYVTDFMLMNAGVNPADVEYVNIPKIKDRNDMLAAGDVDAATLPQPYYALSSQAGANVLIDDAVLDYVPEAINFRAEILAEKGEQVRAMLGAYERALEDINAHETREEGIAWLGAEVRTAVRDRAVAMEDERVAEFMRLLVEAETWPSMTAARVPTVEEFTHAQDWALAVGLVSEALAYENVIDGSYLTGDDERRIDLNPHAKKQRRASKSSAALFFTIL